MVAERTPRVEATTLERDALVERIELLEEHVEFRVNVMTIEYDLLSAQLHAMQAYLRILNIRLAKQAAAHG